MISYLTPSTFASQIKNNIENKMKASSVFQIAAVASSAIVVVVGTSDGALPLPSSHGKYGTWRPKSTQHTRRAAADSGSGGRHRRAKSSKSSSGSSTRSSSSGSKSGKSSSASSSSLRTAKDMHNGMTNQGIPSPRPASHLPPSHIRQYLDEQRKKHEIHQEHLDSQNQIYDKSDSDSGKSGKSSSKSSKGSSQAYEIEWVDHHNDLPSSSSGKSGKSSSAKSAKSSSGKSNKSSSSSSDHIYQTQAITSTLRPTPSPSTRSTPFFDESSPFKLKSSINELECTGDPCEITTWCRSRYGTCGPGRIYCSELSTWTNSCSTSSEDGQGDEEEEEVADESSNFLSGSLLRDSSHQMDDYHDKGIVPDESYIETHGGTPHTEEIKPHIGGFIGVVVALLGVPIVILAALGAWIKGKQLNARRHHQALEEVDKEFGELHTTLDNDDSVVEIS